MSINDIPISELLDQYMEYINAYAMEHTEIAAEFLEMAAKLLYIKTASLLPKPQAAEELKRELVGRLTRYALIKELALRLKTVYNGNTFTVRSPLKLHFDTSYALEHDCKLLLDAFAGIRYVKPTEQLTGESFEGIVKNKTFSVGEKIVYILKILYKTGLCKLTAMFSDISDRSERVATFLAVLEMTKSGRILLNNDNSEIRFNR
jgi:segregation and condensation protein A